MMDQNWKMTCWWKCSKDVKNGTNRQERMIYSQEEKGEGYTIYRNQKKEWRDRTCAQLTVRENFENTDRSYLYVLAPNITPTSRSRVAADSLFCGGTVLKFLEMAVVAVLAGLLNRGVFRGGHLTAAGHWIFLHVIDPLVITRTLATTAVFPWNLLNSVKTGRAVFPTAWFCNSSSCAKWTLRERARTTRPLSGGGTADCMAANAPPRPPSETLRKAAKVDGCPWQARWQWVQLVLKVKALKRQRPPVSAESGSPSMPYLAQTQTSLVANRHWWPPSKKLDERGWYSCTWPRDPQCVAPKTGPAVAALIQSGQLSAKPIQRLGPFAALMEPTRLQSETGENDAGPCRLCAHRRAQGDTQQRPMDTTWRTCPCKHSPVISLTAFPMSPSCELGEEGWPCYPRGADAEPWLRSSQSPSTSTNTRWPSCRCSVPLNWNWKGPHHRIPSNGSAARRQKNPWVLPGPNLASRSAQLPWSCLWSGNPQGDPTISSDNRKQPGSKAEDSGKILPSARQPHSEHSQSREGKQPHPTLSTTLYWAGRVLLAMMSACNSSRALLRLLGAAAWRANVKLARWLDLWHTGWSWRRSWSAEGGSLLKDAKKASKSCWGTPEPRSTSIFLVTSSTERTPLETKAPAKCDKPDCLRASHKPAMGWSAIWGRAQVENNAQQLLRTGINRCNRIWKWKWHWNWNIILKRNNEVYLYLVNARTTAASEVDESEKKSTLRRKGGKSGKRLGDAGMASATKWPTQLTTNTFIPFRSTQRVSGFINDRCLHLRVWAIKVHYAVYPTDANAAKCWSPIVRENRMR